jgi:hypothetical protein
VRAAAGRRQCGGSRGDNSDENEESDQCQTPNTLGRTHVLDALAVTPPTPVASHPQHQIASAVDEMSRAHGITRFTELTATKSFIVPTRQILISTTYPADQKHC